MKQRREATPQRAVVGDGRGRLGRVASWFLVAFGVWSLIIWPRFMKAIWDDKRSWDNGPTSFFLVHAVLVAVSIVAGVAIGVIGWRSVRGLRKMNP